jgi:hypothetical protein
VAPGEIPSGWGISTILGHDRIQELYKRGKVSFALFAIVLFLETVYVNDIKAARALLRVFRDFLGLASLSYVNLTMRPELFFRIPQVIPGDEPW